MDRSWAIDRLRGVWIYLLALCCPNLLERIDWRNEAGGQNPGSYLGTESKASLQFYLDGTIAGMCPNFSINSERLPSILAQRSPAGHQCLHKWIPGYGKLPVQSQRENDRPPTATAAPIMMMLNDRLLTSRPDAWLVGVPAPLPLPPLDVMLTRSSQKSHML